MKKKIIYKVNVNSPAHSNEDEITERNNIFNLDNEDDIMKNFYKVFCGKNDEDNIYISTNYIDPSDFIKDESIQPINLFDFSTKSKTNEIKLHDNNNNIPGSTKKDNQENSSSKEGKDNKKHELNKNKLFLKKKRGRISNSKKQKSGRGSENENKKVHGDEISDNMERKVKHDFLKQTFNLMLKKINQNQRRKKPKRLQYRLKMDRFNKVGPEENKQFMEMSIEEAFSGEVYESYQIEDRKANATIFKKVLRIKKEKELIKIFQKKVKDLWKVYIKETNNEYEFYKDFTKLEDVLNDLKKKGKTEEYCKLYEDTAKKMLSENV